MKSIKVILLFIAISKINIIFNMLEPIKSDNKKEQIELVKYLCEIASNKSTTNAKDIYNQVFNIIINPIIIDVFEDPYEESLTLLKQNGFDFNVNHLINNVYSKIQEGDIEKAKLLLEYNQNNNLKEKILYLAISDNDFKIAKFLIEQKADINYKETSITTIFFKIIAQNIMGSDEEKENVFEFIKFLLKNGLNINSEYNKKAIILLQIYYPQYIEELLNIFIKHGYKK